MVAWIKVCKWVLGVLLVYGLFLFVWSFLIKVNILSPQLDQWRIFERYEPPDWLQPVLVGVGIVAFLMVYWWKESLKLGPREPQA